MRKLLTDASLVPELRARCLLAACEVLSGQGAALAVDTRDFHGHLYRLAELPPSVAAAGGWSGAGTLLTGQAGVDASKLWVCGAVATGAAPTQRCVAHPRAPGPCRRARCPPCSCRACTGRLTPSALRRSRSACLRCAPQVHCEHLATRGC